MEFKNAQYLKQPQTDKITVVKATIDGKETFIPMNEENTHYEEILKQVKEGTLTIKDAE